MSDNPYSPSWYRVAHLRPRLRSHNRITRHVYRGQISYILEDQVTGHVYRFTPETYRFIGLMNGDYTVQEIPDGLAKKSYTDLPTQDQVIEILSQLHTMDALICDVPPDTNELLLRRKKQDQPHLYSQLKKSILFLRFPLFDPEKWLKKYGQIFTFIFTRPFLWLLSGLFLVTTIQLALHWRELTNNIFDTLFTRNNLLIIWLIYPLIKTIHEFAHAFAVKKCGGRSSRDGHYVPDFYARSLCERNCLFCLQRQMAAYCSEFRRYPGRTLSSLPCSAAVAKGRAGADTKHCLQYCANRRVLHSFL